MKAALHHVAILVESIESTLRRNSFPAEELGAIEEFPSEGTRELYIGQPVMGRILLMQAIGSGPYQRAFEKRGQGLHHVGLDIERLDEFVGLVSGSGWYLHPASLDSYNKKKQVYLCRPGVPILMEIQERQIFPDDDYFVQKVEFPFLHEGLAKALMCDRIVDEKQFRLLDENGKVMLTF